MDVAKMKNFRNQHYFETHGDEFLSKHKLQHDCVYQFQLDHRFLPVPVNPDVYGRSRLVLFIFNVNTIKLTETDFALLMGF